MSISKFRGHMRSAKLNFSANVLTLGLKDFVKRKIWRELRTRPTFDRCVFNQSFTESLVCLPLVTTNEDSRC